MRYGRGKCRCVAIAVVVLQMIGLDKLYGCLTVRIAVVLGNEIRDRQKTGVIKLVPECDGRAGQYGQMLVHQALFVTAFPGPEQPDHRHSVDNPVFQFPVEEHTAKRKDNSTDVLGQRGTLPLYLLNQFRRQVFVGIEAKHPPGLYIKVIKGPVELRRLIPGPRMHHHLGSHLPCNPAGAVRRLAVNDDYSLRLQRPQPLQASADMQLLILCQNYDSNIKQNKDV